MLPARTAELRAQRVVVLRAFDLPIIVVLLVGIGIATFRVPGAKDGKKRVGYFASRNGRQEQYAPD